MGPRSSKVGKFLVDENISTDLVPTLAEICIKIRSSGSGNHYLYPCFAAWFEETIC